MPDVYYDRNWLAAESVGAKRFQYPFRNNGDRTSSLFEEDYWQREVSFVPLELSTQHPENAGFYLINESEPTRFGFGDLLKFTRTYARVPAQQVEHSSILISLPQPSSVGGSEGKTKSITDSTSFALVTEKGYMTPNFVYAAGAYYDSLVSINGQAFDSNTNTFTVNVANHSFTNSTPLVFVADGNANNFWAALTIPGSSWTNVNANAISFTTLGNLTRPSALAQYSHGSFGLGSRYIRCKRITDFYLPGITTGISTADDIPLPQDQSDSEQFITALLSGTGTINVQVGEVQRWKDSPIYCITKTTINIEDLV